MKKYSTIIVLLFILLSTDTLVVDSNQCCINTCNIDEDGEYMVRINHRENLTSPSLNIEDSTYRVVQYETNGSIINTQKLEIYKEYKLDKDLGSAYIKKLYLERINSTIKGFYMITGTSNRSFLNVTINYTVALSGYKKIIKQFKQHIITNNYKDLLKWNITWNEFLLLINKSSGYSNADSVYEEKGQCHELINTIEDVVLNDDIVRDSVFYDITGLPKELDPYLVFSEKTIYLEIVMRSSENHILIHKKYYTLIFIPTMDNNYLLVDKIGDKQLRFYLGDYKYVLVKSIEWKGSYLNNQFYIEILMRGRGLGGSRSERIYAVIYELRELTRYYECFYVESSSIMFRLDKVTSSNLCINQTFDINKLEIMSNVDQETSIVLWLIISLGGIVSIIVFYLVLRIFRSRRQGSLERS